MSKFFRFHITNKVVLQYTTKKLAIERAELEKSNQGVEIYTLYDKGDNVIIQAGDITVTTFPLEVEHLPAEKSQHTTDMTSLTTFFFPVGGDEIERPQLVLTAAEKYLQEILKDEFPETPKRVEYNKSSVEGRYGVKSPYNQEFVEELKRRIPSASFNRREKRWYFDADELDKVHELVQKYFSDVMPTRITFDLDGQLPVIDGVNLATANRDGDWSWRNSPEIKFTVDAIEPKEVETRRRGMHCKLTIIAYIRENALIEPTPIKVEKVKS